MWHTPEAKARPCRSKTDKEAGKQTDRHGRESLSLAEQAGRSLGQPEAHDWRRGLMSPLASDMGKVRLTA